MASPPPNTEPPLPLDTNRAESDKWSTPVMISPPISKTPPTDGTRSEGLRRKDIHRNSEPVDAQGLSRALNNLERGGREREHTPGSSPSRKRPRVYGDRFIPNREGRDYSSGFNLLHDDASPATPSKSRKRPPNNEINFQKSKPLSTVFFAHCANTSNQPRKPTEPFRPSCAPRCSTTLYQRPYHQVSALTLSTFTVVVVDPVLLPQTAHPSQRLI